jgi:hypothetical protein
VPKWQHTTKNGRWYLIYRFLHIIFEPQPVLPSSADKFAFVASAGTLLCPITFWKRFRAGHTLAGAERKRWLVLGEIRRRKGKLTDAQMRCRGSRKANHALTRIRG